MSKRCGLILAVAVLAGSCGAARGSAVESLESLVRQWVELRAQLAEEQREGRRAIERLHEEIDLLESERRALRQELESYRERARAAGEERVALEAQEQEYRAGLEALDPLLERAEAALRDWRPVLPAPLARQMRDSFDLLPAENPDGRDRARRLRVVLALYAGIESWQHGVYARREIMPVGGSERAVDVLYLGLGQAYAVSPDDGWAAVGRFRDGRWRWEERAASAVDIRRAWDVAQGDLPPELVILPVAVNDSEIREKSNE